MTTDTIYLDHAATTPLRPAVLEAMRPFLEAPGGNPSSAHARGRAARAALEQARERVAAALGAARKEIVFTGGGTEADNLAVLGRWRAAGGGVALSAVEHSAVREPAARAAGEGASVTTIAVDESGRLDMGGLEEVLTEPQSVVSVMWANNETGVMQPVAEIASKCRAAGVVYHTDAVQAVGHVPVRVDEVPCDLLSLSGHKLGGPAGVGALFVRSGTELSPLVVGGGQEGGLRAGTSNVAGAVGLARAMELATDELAAESRRLESLRDELQAALCSRLPGLRVNGDGAERLPHTLSVALDGPPADALFASLDMEGLAVSTGSACRSGATGPSHVMVAMGVVSDAVIRFSLGWSTTAEEVRQAAEIFVRAVERTREAVGA